MKNTATRKAAAEARGWTFSTDPAMGTIHIADHADHEVSYTDPELVGLLDAVEDFEAELLAGWDREQAEIDRMDAQDVRE